MFLFSFLFLWFFFSFFIFWSGWTGSEFGCRMLRFVSGRLKKQKIIIIIRFLDEISRHGPRFLIGLRNSCSFLSFFWGFTFVLRRNDHLIERRIRDDFVKTNGQKKHTKKNKKTTRAGEARPIISRLCLCIYFFLFFFSSLQNEWRPNWLTESGGRPSNGSSDGRGNRNSSQKKNKNIFKLRRRKKNE